MIEFLDIWKSFGERCVLAGVDLHVASGEILFIVGSSGAGKSVLVKHLVGLLRPDKGRILLDGREISALTEREFYEVRKRCAMVFQNATLFDSMSLVDNVALPIRKHHRVKQSEARRRALEKLELVGMAQLADRFPAEFGDGMRKKVAIARALTLDPEFVIFDEPTTGVDPLSARMVDRVIADLSRRCGVTAIVISHDLRSIFSIADRIAFLYQGRLRLDGSPQDFRQSTDPVVVQFVHGHADGPMQL